MRLPFLLLAVALAGCTMGGHVHGPGLDTGDIEPGASATLSFDAAGEYELHCHPHPFMTHTVVVAEGAAAEAHVHIVDGESDADYRFEPASIEVAPGAVVTYHNHGRLVHTATQASAIDH